MYNSVGQSEETIKGFECRLKVLMKTHSNASKNKLIRGQVGWRSDQLVPGKGMTKTPSRLLHSPSNNNANDISLERCPSPIPMKKLTLRGLNSELRGSKKPKE